MTTITTTPLADHFCRWIDQTNPNSGRHCGRTGNQGPLFEIIDGPAPTDNTIACTHHLAAMREPSAERPEFFVLVNHIPGTGMTVYGLIQRLSQYDPNLPLAQHYTGEHELVDVIDSGGTDDKPKLLCFQFGASPVDVDFDPIQENEMRTDREELARIVSQANFPSSWVQGESLQDLDGRPLSPERGRLCGGRCPSRLRLVA